MPSFLGKDLETYGPFEEGDQTELPDEIVSVLLNKGRVEEVTDVHSTLNKDVPVTEEADSSQERTSG